MQLTERVREAAFACPIGARLCARPSILVSYQNMSPVPNQARCDQHIRITPLKPIFDVIDSISTIEGEGRYRAHTTIVNQARRIPFF
jgi:hypothetical protein